MDVVQDCEKFSDIFVMLKLAGMEEDEAARCKI